MTAVGEIVGQQLLSPRPRFGRWQAERVFFFLTWPQPDYISAQTLDFWSIIVFEELLLIYFTHLGFKQKFVPPYDSFRNTLWNFMEYFETYSFLGLL